jgi:hypothetical protein
MKTIPPRRACEDHHNKEMKIPTRKLNILKKNKKEKPHQSVNIMVAAGGIYLYM